MNDENNLNFVAQTEEVLLSELQLSLRGARVHSDKQIMQLGVSMQAFGFYSPIVINAENEVLIGVGRYLAAQKIGLATAPCVRVNHLTSEQCRLLAIADNKLAENSKWDHTTLKIEIAELSAAGLDLTITGFETGEIDFILQSPTLEMCEGDPADLDALPVKHSPVTQAGDVWVLGDHRLMCGDVLAPETLKTLMGDELAAMTFNDPPYNVPISGHVTVDNKSQHDEFVMGVGEMSEAEFTQFLTDSLAAMAAYCRNGALNYACMDWRHHSEMGVAGRAVFSELKNICVWDKGVGGMGSLYRSQYEMIFVFKKGTSPHINNIQLGKFGRNRTNVWSYPGVNALGGAERQETLAMHPTVKPTAMIADAILDCTNLNDIVLDGFAGSGTTIIAAERTGRRARCVEIDPGYVDVAIGRWERLTGLQAVLEGQGKTFAEVAADRGVDLHAPAADVALDKEAANVLAD